VAGTLTVLFTYLLTKRLFRKESIAVLSALFVAIEPWSLFLSRAALEANVALFLIVSGVYFFLIGLEKKNYNLLLGVLLLGLSVWTYNSARIFVPLFLVACTLVYKTEFISLVRRNKILATGYFLLATAFLVPMFVQLAQSTGQARYENVRILDAGAVGEIERLRSNSDLPLSRLVFNKATYFAFKFGKNYLSHFSPSFLFLEGGSHYQFSVPGHGLVYLVNAPFLVLGLYSVLKSRKEKYSKLFLVWLALGPVASSLTREAPHALRSIVVLPVPMILVALGIFYVFEKLPKARWFTAVYLLVLFVSFTDYFNSYLNDYRERYSWSWQYGYKQVVDVVKGKYDKYEKIVITKKYGEPHEFLLFYGGAESPVPWPWEPDEFREDPNLIRFSQSNWYWVDRFDKFYFVNDWDIPGVGSEFVLESGSTFSCASCLLITGPGNAPENWDKLETINFLNGEVAFEIYEH
jgi:hypothetical protein